MRVLDRREWQALVDEVAGRQHESMPPTQVTIGGSVVSVERNEESYVDIISSEHATDIRIGHTQLIACRNRLVLLTRDTVPAREWTVIYDGPVKPEEE